MKEINNLISPENSELGKQSQYEDTYNPGKLFPILRSVKRIEIAIDSKALPFFGFDHWNHYEISWLNQKGKPIVALGELRFEAASTHLIESKSMKLYLNSFNNTRFENVAEVIETIQKDLENCVKSRVIVKIIPMNEITNETVLATFEGISLDNLDIECSIYTVTPQLLQLENAEVTETVYSDLLRSNCLVTGQPDWGSIQISYQGKKINHASLLQYIVSFRNHTEFGEHCVERIFMDLMRECKPAKLTVECRYTRRGGIDINCFRSTHQMIKNSSNRRLCRQ